MFTFIVFMVISAIFNVDYGEISNDIQYLGFILCVINDLTLISRAANSGGKG